MKRQKEMDAEGQVGTRRLNGAQLRGLLSMLAVGEKKLSRDHWTDVFHEDDGEPATGFANKKVGSKELAEQLSTIYRSAQGEIGCDILP